MKDTTYWHWPCNIKSPEILCLQNLIIFMISDDSIFLKGVEDFIKGDEYTVPNRRLLLPYLIHLPANTRLPILLYGQSLIVTDNEPFSINHVSLKILDAFTNRWLEMHDIVRPFLILSH